MKTRALALRVALNSALMILVVYLAMQVVVYLRDQAIFGFQNWSDFFPAVFGFIGASVLPPLVVFAVLLWWMALPIERAARRLEAGIALTDDETEKTRRHILRFRTIVLTVNLIGFTVGFLIDLIVTGKLGDLVHVHRLSILLSNLCGAFVLAAAQTSLNNVVFAPVRDRLGITSLGDRKRQTSTTTRQLRLTVAMVLYAILVLQYNQHDATSFQSWGDEIQAQVVAGTLPADEATAAYRALVAEKMPTIFSRDPALAATLVPPWESTTPVTSAQEAVFLLVGALMTLIALGVQAAVSHEQRESTTTLQARIRDVVAGGGDLRKRLALREMDDQGELADLVNRLLDLFQTIVGRIGGAASQTKEGAKALDIVLSRAEDVSAQVGSSVAILKAELEDQTSQSRMLTDALGAFREAAAAVGVEAGTQGRYVSETSSAMEEMAASIEGVRQKSREAGALTEALARQGEGGGLAVRETGEAIEAIHRSSIEVLQVLGALKKIAADTNLLAMNAAIEAAHAGEKGAGFAVVADEVRSLATNAQAQTKTIKELIQAMARQVEAGVARSRAAGQVLSDLVQGLQDSAQVSAAVADAMEEQAARTRGVGESLTQVVRTSDTIRQKMTTQAQTTDAMAGTLGRAMERLSALVETSQIQVQAVAGLEASFAEVRTEVDRNAAAAETLQAEVGRFQV